MITKVTASAVRRTSLIKDLLIIMTEAIILPIVGIILSKQIEAYHLVLRLPIQTRRYSSRRSELVKTAAW